MQDNKNYQGHLIPVRPMPIEAIQIVRLLTFGQSLRYHLETFVFDANDALDTVPYQSGSYTALPRFGQVNTRLKSMRKYLDFLIDDLDLYTTTQ